MTIYNIQQVFRLLIFKVTSVNPEITELVFRLLFPSVSGTTCCKRLAVCSEQKVLLLYFDAVKKKVPGTAVRGREEETDDRRQKYQRSCWVEQSQRNSRLKRVIDVQYVDQNINRLNSNAVFDREFRSFEFLTQKEERIQTV